MGAFIARQPNGLICRFSTVVDTVTDYNMTEEEYIELCAEHARDEARVRLKHHVHPFDAASMSELRANTAESDLHKR